MCRLSFLTGEPKSIPCQLHQFFRLGPVPSSPILVLLSLCYVLHYFAKKVNFYANDTELSTAVPHYTNHLERQYSGNIILRDNTWIHQPATTLNPIQPLNRVINLSIEWFFIYVLTLLLIITSSRFAFHWITLDLKLSFELYLFLHIIFLVFFFYLVTRRSRPTKIYANIFINCWLHQ